MRYPRLLANILAVIFGSSIGLSLYSTLHGTWYMGSEMSNIKDVQGQLQHVGNIEFKAPELKVTLPQNIRRRLEAARLMKSLNNQGEEGMPDNSGEAENPGEPKSAGRHESAGEFEYAATSEYVVLKKDPEFIFRRNPNFRGSKCPVSLQQKLATLEWTRDIYHPEIHQIMHPGLLNLSEYNRLLPYWMPYGYKYHDKLTIEDLREIMNLFNTKSDIVSVPESQECVTCAVVGNGGVLKGAGKGEEIDDHDMVFRVNNALRAGYEEDVGSRTTHYVLMDRSLIKMPREQVPRDEGIKYLFLPCRLKDYYYIRDVVTGASAKQKLTTDPSSVRVFHPDFIRYFQKLWMVTKSFRPSTGAVMFAAALHGGCDQISVYGMGFNTQYSEHYYDKKYQRYVNFKGSHDFQREIKILKELHKNGVIDWYTRDIKEFQS